MNLKKLFVVGSMLVMAWTTANAELVNGVRQKPEPATTAWTVGTEEAPYYLYNTSAKLFFTQGNTWGTRGCVGPVASALKVYFSETAEGSGEYFLNDYVYIIKDKKGSWSWKMACGEGGADAVYTDQGSGWGRPKWVIVPQSGNIFRIQTTTPLDAEDLTPKYMGRNDSIEQNYYNAYSEFTDDNKRFPVSVELTEDKTSHIDWALVSAADYEVLAAATVLYDKAEELMSYINSAKELGIEMSAETAIYENEASTVEEMDAAIEGIQNKIKAKQAGEATLDNPADMTASIVNPGFANSKTGWNGNDPGFGEGAAEFYQANYDFYQTLKDMPNGVYGVSVQAFYRTSWADVSYKDWQNKTAVAAKVYAKSGADSLNTALFNAWAFAQTGDTDGYTELKNHGTWSNSANKDEVSEDGYIPNNMKAAAYVFSLDPNNYKQTAYVAVDNGELTFGLKKNDSNPGGNWTLFDNFTLSYFGTAPEAYQMALTKGMPAKTEYSTANVSKQYIDAYDAAYTQTATDKASFSAAVKAVADANDSIAKNTQLWVDLKDKYDAAYAATVEYDLYDAAWNLGDYLADGLDENGESLIPMGVKAYTEAAAKEDKYDLSNKEIEDIIAEIDSQLDILYKEVKEGLKPNTDVTKFLTNPGFEDGTNGWTIVSKGGGNVNIGGNDANHCYEAWHSTNFDVYQEVSNLPVGMYKLEVNGFVRYLDGNDALTKANEAPEDPGIYLYMNESKTHLVNLLTYPKPKSFYDAISGAKYLMQDEDNCYPDNMTAASAAFAEGGYSQSTMCLVDDASAVTRLGVKGTPEAKFWPIFDNFKLTYMGMAVETVKPELDAKITEAEKYENVLTTKTAKEHFTATLATAKEAAAGEDGTAMFNALSALEKAINEVVENKAICEKFAEFIEDYMQFAQYVESQEALELGSTILENLNACAYDADEIEAKKLELREMRLKVQLPADYAETSADGKDLTAFIQNPGFSTIKDGVETNSNDGWLGTAGSFGPDEHKSNFCLEFYNKQFDMYQDLTSVGSVVLPRGYYALQVNAFNRPAESNPAYLYAVADKDTLDVVAIKLQSEGFNAEEGEPAPNDVTSAKQKFDELCYVNTLKFLFEGDTLRIGVKHPVNVDRDWVIMDDFKLFFYGTDNTGVETVNLIGKPAKVQYFTLDGRQVSAARKGLVIRKTTMDNGAVVVRKIQK